MSETNSPPTLVKRLAPLAVVALLALVIGVVGGRLLWRSRPAPGPNGPATEGGHAGMPGMSGDQRVEPPPGASDKAVYISPARQQMIGVRTAVVGHQELDTTIRTVGTLAYDETRVSQVHSKIAGWVEKVFVDYVGKAVRRDEPLFSVYSPDLVSTQKEYLLALKARSELGTSQVPATRAAAESLLAAARDRLKLWDVPDEHVAELERTGEVRKSMMFHSPFDGIVLERNAFPGQYITPEMTTFKIADLSRIWALGAVFEYELPLLRMGQEAEIEFPYGQATRTLKGTISYISPEIDPQTRRVKIRAEFPNPGLKLKPETFVTVVIRTRGGHNLAIPKEAVLDSGAKRYAIVVLPNGYFDPRPIQVGQPGDELYPLLAGLVEGDRIATSAQFLIDSETNLQAAMQSMIGMPGMDVKGAAVGAKKTAPPGPSPAAPQTATPPAHTGHGN
jgi:Cu(I)/Ag(I) efflux system membrane fusion protein